MRFCATPSRSMRCERVVGVTAWRPERTTRHRGPPIPASAHRWRRTVAPGDQRRGIRQLMERDAGPQNAPPTRTGVHPMKQGHDQPRSQKITGWCVVLADGRVCVDTEAENEDVWERSYQRHAPTDTFLQSCDWRDHQIALGARCFPCEVVEVSGDD